MRTSTIVFFLACALLTRGAVSTVDGAPIESAYGKSLGETFDPKNAIGQSKLPGGIVMYEFTPSKKSDFFKSFYVLITPKTNKIYSIWAISAVDKIEKIVEGEKDLVERLRKKYGESKNEGAFAYPLPDAIRFEQGKRSIVLKAHDHGDGFAMDITYLDNDLEKLAEKERQESVKEKEEAL